MSKSLLFISLACLFMTACASGTFKARQEQREKLASSTGMYCDFISGDLFPDLEVELSMSMAKRCDSTKNFSITNYKNTSDQSGVVYCCATRRNQPAAAVSPKKDEKAEEISVD